MAAPMVHQSELAFRSLVRQNGCHLAFTQMIQAHKYATSPKFRENMCDWQTHASDDRPLIVQLNGHDPNSLVATGKLLAGTVDGIDLNLGCPQHIAKRGMYGAYLLQDTKLSLHIISRMTKEIDCPISVKVRIFDDPKATLEFAQAAEECGIQMITVHGRTIHEKKQFVKEANWSVIQQIKASLSIPVVANGGIGCHSDIHRCLKETGVDAVMSSEALLENPKLFCPDGDRAFRFNFIQSQIATVHEYLALLQRYPQPYMHTPVVKAHLFKMLYRFLAAPKNHDLRQLLGQCNDVPKMATIVREIQERTKEYEGKDSEAVMDGFLHDKTWYERYHDREILQTDKAKASG